MQVILAQILLHSVFGVGCVRDYPYSPTIKMHNLGTVHTVKIKNTRTNMIQIRDNKDIVTSDARAWLSNVTLGFLNFV